MNMKQYKLRNIDSGSYKVCWLDGDLKVGVRITLKDEPGKYEVVENYNTEVSKDQLNLNRNPIWYSI